jgi:hypothetical protein
VSVLTGGTDVHLVLVDLRESELDGKQAEDRLHDIGITVNRNAVPFDPRPPMVTSGLRVGTPRSPRAACRPDDLHGRSAAILARRLQPGWFRGRPRGARPTGRGRRDRRPLPAVYANLGPWGAAATSRGRAPGRGCRILSCPRWSTDAVYACLVAVRRRGPLMTPLAARLRATAPRPRWTSSGCAAWHAMATAAAARRPLRSLAGTVAHRRAAVFIEPVNERTRGIVSPAAASHSTLVGRLERHVRELPPGPSLAGQCDRWRCSPRSNRSIRRGMK